MWDPINPKFGDGPDLSPEELAHLRDRLGDGDDSGQDHFSKDGYNYFG